MTAQPSTKKGQIQLNETILVLFVIVLLIFMLVFLFYKYSIANIKETAVTLSEEDQTVLLASFPVLPELGCDLNPCMDTGKFFPFSSLVQVKQLYYAQLLGKASIWVEQLYPEATEGLCTSSHYHAIAYPGNCNRWELYENKPVSFTKQHKLSTVVSLYYPESDTYGIGRFHVEVYL